jgi:hypothetical protein
MHAEDEDAGRHDGGAHESWGEGGEPSGPNSDPPAIQRQIWKRPQRAAASPVADIFGGQAIPARAGSLWADSERDGLSA